MAVTYVKRKVWRVGLYVNWDGRRKAWFHREYHFGLYKCSLENANRLLQAMRGVRGEFEFKPEVSGNVGWIAERQSLEEAKT